jgi:hypothetical protein
MDIVPVSCDRAQSQCRLEKLCISLSNKASLTEKMSFMPTTNLVMPVDCVNARSQAEYDYVVQLHLV